MFPHRTVTDNFNVAKQILSGTESTTDSNEKILNCYENGTTLTSILKPMTKRALRSMVLRRDLNGQKNWQL